MKIWIFRFPEIRLKFSSDSKADTTITTVCYQLAGNAFTLQRRLLGGLVLEKIN